MREKKGLQKVRENRELYVTKANDLIQLTRHSLTERQQKIVLYIISKISIHDKDFREVSFMVQDFCKLCGIDFESGKNYSDVKKELKALRDKSWWIVQPDRSWQTFAWVSSVNIQEQSGLIKIRLDDALKRYLLDLKRDFTTYQLIYTLPFKSKYSIRLYELLRSYHFQGHGVTVKQFALDELRLRCDAEKYAKFYDLKRWVIVPSIKEINRYTDLLVSFDEEKEGRSVARIRITIKTKTNKEISAIQHQIDHELNPEQTMLWDVELE